MPLKMKAVIVAILLSRAAASPAIRPRLTSTAACAQVSSSAAAVLATAPSATPTVDAQLAYDCLNSASLHTEQATDLVQAILPFVEWQTTIEYLIDPPVGYTEPAVDLRAGFADILGNISSGAFSSEYAFQAQLLKLFNSAHDGHFRFAPDLLTKALAFSRPLPLVSVSLDGKSDPKVYSYDDILNHQNSTFIPSALATIDSENVYEYLEALSQLGRLNDPDALYNTIFYSPGFGALDAGWGGYFTGSGAYGYIYPGANTSVTFENGTSLTIQNYASVIGSFANVDDGESLYQEFCTGPSSTSTNAAPTSSSTSTQTTSAITPPIGYPEPIFISSDTECGGYYLPDSDVAVLALLSFEPSVPAEWQMVVQEFLAAAKADGKTKLVIDLAANGGGLIYQGYDTFRQLFPQILQDGFTRFRSQEGLIDIAEEISALFPAGFDPHTSDNEELINYWLSVTNYRYDYNFTDEDFPTFPAKFGPAVFNNDNFTNIIRWNFDDPLTATNATWGIGEDITGYGVRTNFTQPFAAEDIVLIYDGYCASTCTIFSEFMRTQGGVKSIAFGGRTPPSGESTPAIQGVGGVKGANNYDYGYINELAAKALESDPTNTVIAALANDLPVNRSTDTSVNVRDNILRTELASGTPAQFIYEPADCRLFYTPEMVKNVTGIWEAAAAAKWGGAACNAGAGFGTGNASSILNKRSKHVKRDMQIVTLNGAVDIREKSEMWKAEHVMSVPV